ncbi:MAG: hypothetical protein V4543_06990 [Bacteroidota bacterium]
MANDINYFGSTAYITGPELSVINANTAVNIQNTGGVTLGANVGTNANVGSIYLGKSDATVATFLNPGNFTVYGGTFRQYGNTTLNITNTLGVGASLQSTTKIFFPTSSVVFKAGVNQSFGATASLTTSMANASVSTATSGTNLTLDADVKVRNFTVASGTTFNGSDGTAHTITLSDSGAFTVSGTFTPALGTIAFAGGVGTGTVTGASTFYGLNVSGTVSLATIPTINGTLTLNSGYSINRVPVYGSSSTLAYVGVSAPGAEWTATADGAAGSARPNNVSILSGSLTLGGARSAAGGVSIAVGATFALNASSGDLYLRGDFTNNGTFTGNNRAVRFNGTSTQSVAGTASISIPYLLIENTGNVKLMRALTLSGSGGSPLQFASSGNLDLNDFTVTLSNGTSGIKVTSTGGLTNSGVATGTVSVNADYNLDFANTQTLTVGTGVNFSVANGTTFSLNSRNMTVNGELTLNGSAVIGVGGTPTYIVYGSASNLAYASYSGSLGNEWTRNTASGVIGTDAGFPNNVIVRGGTLTTPGADRYLNGNFGISSGATFVQANGGDLYMGGSWADTGTFSQNSQQIVRFIGTGTQTVYKSGGETFVGFAVGGSGTVKLLSNLTVNTSASRRPFQLTGTGNLDLNGFTLNVTGVSSTGANGILTSSAGGVTNSSGTLGIVNISTNSNRLDATSSTPLTIGSNVNLNISTGKTLDLNGKNLVINGGLSFTGTGAFVGNSVSSLTIGTGTGTVDPLTFSGTSALSSLTINRSGTTVKSAGNLSLGTGAGALTLTAGSFDINGFNLTLGTGGTVVGESAVNQLLNTGAATAYVQGAATVNGSPVNIGGLHITVDGTSLGTITAKRFFNTALDLVTTNSVTRYYTLAAAGNVSASAITFGYLASELNGNTESAPILNVYSGTSAAACTTFSTSTGSVTSGFPHTISQGTLALSTTPTFITAGNPPIVYVTAQAGDWNTASTWAGGIVPANPATVTINHAITLNGSATGAFVTLGGSGALNIGGAGALSVINNGLISNGGTASMGSGTISFSGNGTLRGSTSASLGNLTLGSGTLSLTTVPTVTGTLSLGTNSVLSVSPIFGSSSVLKYTGTNTPSVEWTSTSAGTVGAGHPASVLVASGATLNMPSTTRALEGSLSIDGTMNMNATSGDIIIGGSFTNSAGSAAFVQNGRLVTFSGTTPSVINTTGGQTFSTLVVSNTGGLTLQSDVTVSGSLTATSGTISRNSTEALNIGSSATLNMNGGSLAFGPTYASGATLYYGGSSPVTTSTEVSSLTSGTTVTVANPGNVTLGSNITAGNMTVSSGAGLVFGNNSFSGTGTFTNIGGTLYISGSGGVSAAVAASGTRTFTSGTIIFNSGTAQNLGRGSLSTTALATTAITVANSGTNLTLDSSITVASLAIASGTTFTGTDGLRRNLTVSSGGYLQNNGTFVGGNYGRVIGAGALDLTGANPIAFSSLYISGALNFSSGLQPIVNDLFRINGGGYVNANTITYGSNSTLQYNATYSLFNEWTATTDGAAGSGRPNNVTVLNGTLSMPATSRAAAGNVTVNTGTTLALNATSGDLFLRGNWTNNGTFTNNDRAVWFTGTNSQSINTADSFAYLLVSKASGTVSLAADISITGTANGGLQLLNDGDIDLNNHKITMNALTGSILAGGTGGGTVRTIGGTGTVELGGGLSAHKSVTNASGRTLTFGPNVTVAIKGGFNFGTGPSLINGTLKMAALGYVETHEPSYGVGSTLLYDNGSSYTQTIEWADATVYHITVAAGTTVTLSSTPRSMAGNLTISGAGAVLDMNNQNQTLTVGGNLDVNSGGSLLLGTVAGGDLVLNGNFTLNGGTFDNNSRAVYFSGTGAQAIDMTGATSGFHYLRVNKASGTLTLNSALVLDRDGDVSQPVADLQVMAGTLNLNNQAITKAAGTSIALLRVTGGVLKPAGTSLSASFDRFSNSATLSDYTDYMAINGRVAYGTNSNNMFSGLSYKDVWVEPTATLTVTGNTTIRDSLYLPSASTLAFGNNTATLSVQNVLNLNGTVSAGTAGGVLALDGSSAQSVVASSTGSVQNLTVNNTSNAVVTGLLKINGKLLITNGFLSTAGSSDFVQLETGSDVTESTTAYVFGNLKTTEVLNTDATTFKGMGLALSAGSDLDTVVVIRHSGSPLNGNAADGMSANTGISRWWSITPSLQPAAPDRNLTLTWPALEDNGRDVSHTQVYTRPTSSDPWAKKNWFRDASGTNPRTTTVNAVAHFSDWTISDDLNPLPVEMLSFTGSSKGKGAAYLNWTTANEFNNAGFAIERSENGKEFSRLGFVAGAGDSRTIRNYNFTDNSFTADAYYRLRQTDKDGKETLSKVIFISVKATRMVFSVAPNPGRDNFRLITDGPVNDIQQLTITDLAGKNVLSASGTMAELEIWLNNEMAGKPAGLYSIRLLGTDGVQAIKLVKE